jgi:hypothetical protein
MAIVTSTSKAAISHTGKRDRAITRVAALVGAGSELVAGRRIGLAQIVDQPQEVGNFSTACCSWGDGALTSLIVPPLTAATQNEHPTSNEAKPPQPQPSHLPRSGICQVRVVGQVQIMTDGWNAYPDTIRPRLLRRLDYAGR